MRLDFAEPAIVLYTRDDWATQVKAETKDTGVGLFVAEISTGGMAAGRAHRLHLARRANRRLARPEFRGRDRVFVKPERDAMGLIHRRHREEP